MPTGEEAPTGVEVGAVTAETPGMMRTRRFVVGVATVGGIVAGAVTSVMRSD